MRCYPQEVLGVPEDVHFLECSDKVGAALGPDVLKSVKHLVPDILASLPLLLYQGRASFPSKVQSSPVPLLVASWLATVHECAASQLQEGGSCVLMEVESVD